MTAEYPLQYLEGIRLFNEEEFFECHDMLEELWTETRGEERKFYQGLIQAAVALFHFGNENIGGARKLYGSSCNYLESYLESNGERYMGIDLKKFLQDFEICFREVVESGPEYPTDVVLKDELVPSIDFENTGIEK